MDCGKVYLKSLKANPGCHDDGTTAERDRKQKEDYFYCLHPINEVNVNFHPTLVMYCIYRTSQNDPHGLYCIAMQTECSFKFSSIYCRLNVVKIKLLAQFKLLMKLLKVH